MNLLPSTPVKERRFQINLKLTPAQTHISENSKRFTILRAGRKFGKTTYTLNKILEWLGPPDSCVWYICPTYKQGRLISWSEIKRMIPPEAMHKKPNDSDLIITLKNGSELYYMGSDEPDSLRGPEPTGVIFDEAAYHRADVWAPVIRPNLSVHKAPALFVSTPSGFNWFKDLEDAAKDDPEWAVFHYTICDNPYIDKDEIEKIKKSCDPRVWNQEYMANYESSVGRVFHEFQDTDRHVQAFPMPKRGDSCYRAIDWGMRDDTGTLWAKKLGMKLFIYREHAENGLPPSAQAKIIENRTTVDENIVSNIIGHDAAKSDAEMRGLTVQWHFMNAGIRPLKLSSRKKEGSRAMIQQLISEDRLVIHPECRKLRKQLLSYSWKDTAMEKTEDGGNDLVDALHYMAEMLQYDLLLNPRKDENLSIEEKIKRHRAEIEDKWKRPRYPLESENEPKSIFQEESLAGYL